MSLIPISKKSLQKLYEIEEEERRVEHVKQTISQIYGGAISAAKRNLKSYSHGICNCSTIRFMSTIEIAKVVQALFPDSTVLIRPRSYHRHEIPLTHPGLMKSTLVDTSILVYEFPQRIVNEVIQSQAYDLYIDWS